MNKDEMQERQGRSRQGQAGRRRLDRRPEAARRRGCRRGGRQTQESLCRARRKVGQAIKDLGNAIKK